MVAAGLYDAYLPDLVPPERMGQLSGWGWGLGYLGGITCFLITIPLTQSGFQADHLAQFRLTFLVVAGFYVTIALPAFRCLPRHSAQSISWAETGTLIRAAYLQVLNTLKNWRQKVNTFQFLGGYYLISDAIVTLNSFIAIYFSSVFGLSVSQILQLSVLFNVISIVSTIGFGTVSDRCKVEDFYSGSRKTKTTLYFPDQTLGLGWKSGNMVELNFEGMVQRALVTQLLRARRISSSRIRRISISRINLRLVGKSRTFGTKPDN